MRRKRFKHHVDTFCDIFCGWRLLNCTDRMIELGSGIYELDFLNRIYSKDGSELGGLSIGEEVALWWREELERLSVPVTKIDQASLKAMIDIKPLVGRRRTADQYPQNPNGDFFACRIKCESLLKSGTDTYTSSKTDYEEWPYPLLLKTTVSRLHILQIKNFDMVRSLKSVLLLGAIKGLL